MRGVVGVHARRVGGASKLVLQVGADAGLPRAEEVLEDVRPGRSLTHEGDAGEDAEELRSM